MKYKALISYSHTDEDWAKWLHGALERYRIPKRLRANHPELPQRLYPVFRDRSDLASSTDLTESVQRALAESEALIAVCSPSAAASRWVNEEIRRFKALGRGHRIFCLLVAGSPERSAADCAFPQALLVDDAGLRVPEPLAADVIRDGGKRTAFLKIAAGLLDVGIDDLKHRDAQRRARWWSAVAAGSLSLTTVTAALAVFAILARNDAEMRREQAENLIGFMLGDLRERLQPIGKLNVLDAVGDQAMRYFEVLGDRGSDAEILARAKALRQIGEVRFHQGRLEPALASFTESHRILNGLHRDQPGNNDYLFELSQSEFWIGYVAWERKDLDEAQQRMERYMECSRTLTQREPGNSAYEFELAQAYSNLGSIARQRGDTERALRQYRASIALYQSLIRRSPHETTMIGMLANAHSWVGRTLLELGNLQASEEALEQAVELLADLHARRTSPEDSQSYGETSLWLAEIRLQQGDRAAAERALDAGSSAPQELIALDPDNAYWKDLALYATYLRASLLATQPQTQDEAMQLWRNAVAGFEDLARVDPTNADYWRRLALLAHLHAELALERGEPQRAAESARRALEYIGRENAPRTDALAVTHAALISETLGFALGLAGDSQGARDVWTQALAKLDAAPETDLPRLAVRRQLAFNLGRHEEAESLDQRLAAAGFNDPRFQRVAALRDQQRPAPIRSARR